MFLIRVLPFPTCRHILRHLHLHPIIFENIVTKGAIPPLVMMLTTLFNNYSFICREFPCFCSDVFKVDSCRFLGCGKELHHFQESQLFRRLQLSYLCVSWFSQELYTTIIQATVYLLTQTFSQSVDDK